MEHPPQPSLSPDGRPRTDIENDLEKWRLYKKFVLRSDVVIAAKREETGRQVAEKIAQIKLPAKTANLADVERELMKQRDLLNMKFAPEDRPEIKATLEAIATENAKGASVQDLERMTRTTNELRQKRRGTLKRFLDLFAQGKVSSPRLEAFYAERAPLRAKLYDFHRHKDELEAAFELGVVERGESAEVIYKSTPELRQMREEFEALEDEFKRVNTAIGPMQREDALAGILTGKDPMDVAEAHESARELWGQKEDGNLTENFERESRALEAARIATSEAEHNLGLLRAQYLNQLRAAHEPVPYALHARSIASILNRVPPEEIIKACEPRKKKGKGEDDDDAASAADEGGRERIIIRKALNAYRARYLEMQADLSQINKGRDPGL